MVKSLRQLLARLGGYVYRSLTHGGGVINPRWWGCSIFRSASRLVDRRTLGTLLDMTDAK
jgi:hypothetical protein